jgi:hypothetical protein
MPRKVAFIIALSALGCVAWAGLSEEGALVVGGLGAAGLVRGLRTAGKPRPWHARALGFSAIALLILILATLLTPRDADLGDPFSFVAGSAILWALEVALAGPAESAGRGLRRRTRSDSGALDSVDEFGNDAAYVDRD